MTFSPTTFPIDDQHLPWGLTIAEAEQQLRQRAWLPPYGGWPNLRIRCRSVLGLAAVECNLRGPGRHKPVLQVSYELPPPPDHRGAGPVAADHWVQPLTRLLGAPAETWRNPEKPRWDLVTATACWEWPTVRLSLSVYGGVRREQVGPTAAGLFLDWQDELTAARPFVPAVQAQATALEAHAAHLTEPLVFATEHAQRPFYLPDYAAEQPHAARSDDARRLAHLALYREVLIPTPTHLHQHLTDHQVALWPVPGQSAWVVSTRWDSVLLTPPAFPSVELVTLRPAKGGGNMQLTIGDLHLSDAYASPTLAHLAAALEKRAGMAVSRVEDYDC